jgi:hypothetical protein
MTNLRSAIKEEFVGVNAVCDCAADNWEPVENHGRLVWIFEEELLEDI